jgi:hypothetical protein
VTESSVGRRSSDARPVSRHVKCFTDVEESLQRHVPSHGTPGRRKEPPTEAAISWEGAYREQLVALAHIPQQVREVDRVPGGQVDHLALTLQLVPADRITMAAARTATVISPSYKSII